MDKGKKAEWDAYGKSRGLTFSSLVRLAIEDYIRRNPGNGQAGAGPTGLQNVIDEIDSRLAVKFAYLETKFSELRATPTPESATRDQQAKILLANVRSHPEGVSTGTLVETSPWDRSTITDILLELRAEGKIHKSKKDNLWRVAK